jgi:hypothetical protein
MDATRTPHTESTRGELGQGIYSLADLRVYLAYSGSRGDGMLALRWLTSALNPVAHQPHQPDYSFSDLISLFVVRELHRHGVSYARIREAEHYMRAARGTDRPFLSHDIATDGHTVFFLQDAPNQAEAANRVRGQRRGQQVSTIAIAQYLRRVRYGEDGIADQWAPTSKVVLNPQVQFGEPVIAGSRVPTRAVADVARRFSVAEASGWLGVGTKAAGAAVQFERDLDALRN